MMVRPGAMSSSRIRNPMVTATAKKVSMQVRYRSPIRLWSVEKIQPKMPPQRPRTS